MYLIQIVPQEYKIGLCSYLPKGFPIKYFLFSKNPDKKQFANCILSYVSNPEIDAFVEVEKITTNFFSYFSVKHKPHRHSQTGILFSSTTFMIEVKEIILDPLAKQAEAGLTDNRLGIRNFAKSIAGKSNRKTF